MRKLHNITADPTRHYLQKAMRNPFRRHRPRVLPVGWYNDQSRNFGDVFEWVLTARKLAVADLEKEQQVWILAPSARPRPYPRRHQQQFPR